MAEHLDWKQPHSVTTQKAGAHQHGLGSRQHTLTALLAASLRQLPQSSKSALVASPPVLVESLQREVLRKRRPHRCQALGVLRHFDLGPVPAGAILWHQLILHHACVLPKPACRRTAGAQQIPVCLSGCHASAAAKLRHLLVLHHPAYCLKVHCMPEYSSSTRTLTAHCIKQCKWLTAGLLDV